MQLSYWFDYEFFQNHDVTLASLSFSLDVVVTTKMETR